MKENVFEERESRVPELSFAMKLYVKSLEEMKKIAFQSIIMQ